MNRLNERFRSGLLSRLPVLLILIGLACGQATMVSPVASGAPQLVPTAIPNTAADEPEAADTVPILIGTEYVIIETPLRVKPLANMLAPLGLTAVKPLPENFSWGKMQSSPEASIDFTRLDTFVKEFQAIGVDTLVLGLRSLSNWASKDIQVQGNFFPLKGGIKEGYLDEYEDWITAVVERYDADGVEDMPGLRYPIRYYEIGVEFSSYEPEPVEEYLDILEVSYRAAHAAYPDVLIAHVAFLTTPALFGPLESGEYEAAFTQLQDKTHSLADMRAILDRPDLFDVLNIHSLGHPYEIEAIVAWLNYETNARGYQKPIIISDTGSTPFIAWGAATACGKPANQMGRLVPPATEADRCRLADYFTRLVNGDADTLHWTQEFIAQDTVKRVVVAADQGIVLIDTAFTEDLLLLKLGIAQAGAGTAAWAGLVDFDRNEYRPVYYALQQLIDSLGDYEHISRIEVGYEDGIRVYEVEKAGQRLWIAWYDPGTLVLPGDSIPQVSAQWTVGAAQVRVDNLAIHSSGPESQTIQTGDGLITITLTPSPVFIFPQVSN
ncbi:MAG: hypothetical protein M1347_00255 [Chloroflexi bacterium]|nr:hypothetical protein [Chloroflexota bacterium]